MDNQPIPIHYGKLEDWLVDRRAVLAKKHTKQYNLCVEKAPQLVQLVRYDIPAAKKAVSRSRAVVEEAGGKVRELQRSFTGLRKRRFELLDRFGILPENVTTIEDIDERDKAVVAFLDKVNLERSLTQRTNVAIKETRKAVAAAAEREVPQLLQAYESHIRAVDSALEATGAEVTPSSQVPFPWLAELLKQAKEHGGAFAGAEGADEKAEEGEAAPVIDWGDDTAADDAPPPVVDWGDSDATAVAEEPAAGAVMINWGDDDGDDGAAAASQPAASSQQVTVEDALSGGMGVAAPPPNTNVDVTVTEHRRHVVEELHGLTAFFSERKFQRIEAAKSGSGREATTGPTLDVDATAEDDEAALACCERLLAAMTDRLFLDLQRMEHNYLAKERYLSQLDQVAMQLQANAARVGDHDQRCVVAAQEAEELLPKVGEAVAAAKAMQQVIEEALSACFAPRPVNLTGDINNISE